MAPYNSKEPNENIFIEAISPMIISKKAIKFCPKLREINRQYERNNNSKLDNGVYLSEAMKLVHGEEKDIPKQQSVFLTKTTASSSTMQSFTSSLYQGISTLFYV